MGTTHNSNDHLISYKDGEMFIQCIRCNQTKHEEEFNRNKNNRYGRNYTCRVCMKGLNRNPTLDNADESFASAARQILICMGYDLEKDIHTQFLKRMKDKGREL